MNELGQSIFEPAPKARWCPHWASRGPPGARMRTPIPQNRWTEISRGPRRRNMFRAYRRAITYRGESGTSTWRGRTSSSCVSTTKSCITYTTCPSYSESGMRIQNLCKYTWQYLIAFTPHKFKPLVPKIENYIACCCWRTLLYEERL